MEINKAKEPLEESDHKQTNKKLLENERYKKRQGNGKEKGQFRNK